MTREPRVVLNAARPRLVLKVDGGVMMGGSQELRALFVRKVYVLLRSQERRSVGMSSASLRCAT